MYFFRDDLKNKKPNQISLQQKNTMLCLNESTMNPLELLEKEFFQELSKIRINRYLNSITRELPNNLTKYVGFGLREENILYGNGADQMLYYLFTAVRNNDNSFALSLSPSYFDYKTYSAAVNLDIKFINLDKSFDFDEEQFLKVANQSDCKLAILCNPNNPTGNLLSDEKIEYVVKNCKSLVLIDETYYEFTNKTLASKIKDYENLVIIRSFSKAFSSASLRFGYMISNPANIYEIKKVFTLFNTSHLILALANTILKNKEIFIEHNQKVIQMRQDLYERLQEIKEISVFPSKTNFLLFHGSSKTLELHEFLSEKGIVLRNVGSHPLIKNCLRVTVGSEKENDCFIDNLKKYFRRKNA